jgi:hypothetical protein
MTDVTMTINMRMTIEDRDPDSERTIDIGTAIVGHDYTEKKIETGTAAETTTDDVAMTTVEETAVATMTVGVPTTIDTGTGTEIGIEIGWIGKGTEREEETETEIEKVDEPTGLLHATPLTTAVGHPVTLCQQQVVLRLLPARYIIL